MTLTDSEQLAELGVAEADTAAVEAEGAQFAAL
jgi:hypothetical protein